MRMNQGVVSFLLIVLALNPAWVQAKPKTNKNCADCAATSDPGLYPERTAEDVKSIADHEEQAATKYVSTKGSANFHLESLVSDIDADNPSAVCEINIATGKLTAEVKMDQFSFEKSLMKEHFEDEDFLDVKKFPKATFSGTIPDFKKIAESQNGSTFNTSVTGPLSIHGVTKQMTIPVVLKNVNGKLVGSAKTKFLIKDFGIDIPFPKNAILPNDTEIEVKMNFDLEKK